MRTLAVLLSAAMAVSGLKVDVAVIGAGPSGTAYATLLSERHQLDVALIDPGLDKPWPNNYGVWLSEWNALEERLQFDLPSCLDTTWATTDVFLGGHFGVPWDDRKRLKNPYGRVDRQRLKANLRERCAKAGVKALATALEAETTAMNNVYDKNVVHDSDGTTLTLADGTVVRAAVVIDSTGAATRLVRRPDSSELPPIGYQVAYGMEAEVDAVDDLATYVGPYDASTMTLFDYRTNCFKEKGSSWDSDPVKYPTFMYAMPFEKLGPGRRKVFFEETSLVAAPAMTFEECKRRAYERLAFHGIKVHRVFDEEFCYIPMGGPLPEPGQRIVAVGAAAGVVHPATGYQLCRTLAGCGPVSEAIARELKDSLPSRESRAERASRAAYDALWTEENQRQRDFAVFGGDFLMQQDNVMLSGFFDGFFRLPEPYWTGFLAGWPGLPNNEMHETWQARLMFGLRFFTLMPNEVKLALMKTTVDSGIKYGVEIFLRSVTPFFGKPKTYSSFVHQNEPLPGPEGLPEPEALPNVDVSFTVQEKEKTF